MHSIVYNAGQLMLTTEQQRLLQTTASVYLQYQQYDKASPLLQLLLFLFPHDESVHRQLAYLHYQQADYDTAIRGCDLFLRSGHAPQSAWPYLIKSFSFHKLHQPDDAHTNYQRYIAAGPFS